jgi:hypothetical protein
MLCRSGPELIFDDRSPNVCPRLRLTCLTRKSRYTEGGRGSPDGAASRPPDSKTRPVRPSEVSRSVVAGASEHNVALGLLMERDQPPPRCLLLPTGHCRPPICDGCRRHDAARHSAGRNRGLTCEFVGYDGVLTRPKRQRPTLFFVRHLITRPFVPVWIRPGEWVAAVETKNESGSRAPGPTHLDNPRENPRPCPKSCLRTVTPNQRDEVQGSLSLDSLGSTNLDIILENARSFSNHISPR